MGTIRIDEIYGPYQGMSVSPAATQTNLSDPKFVVTFSVNTNLPPFTGNVWSIKTVKTSIPPTEKVEETFNLKTGQIEYDYYNDYGISVETVPPPVGPGRISEDTDYYITLLNRQLSQLSLFNSDADEFLNYVVGVVRAASVRPRINIVRSGLGFVISVPQTQVGFKYRLLAADSLGNSVAGSFTPFSDWKVGTGATLTYDVANNSSRKFFILEQAPE